MTIDQAYLFVQYVANKNQNGNITPDNFNLLAPIAQMSVINDRVGNLKKYRPHDPVPPYGWGISQKIREEMQALLVSTGIGINNSTGRATMPTDILYLDTIVTANNRVATEVSVDEWYKLNISVIKVPTVNNPVFSRVAPEFRFLPFALTSASVFYIRKPTTPVWAYTIVSGRPVYNSGSSQGFELSETTHLEICAKILQTVGVNLDQASISEYAELQEQKGS